MVKIKWESSSKEDFESTNDGVKKRFKEEPYGKIGYGIGFFEIAVIILGFSFFYPSFAKFIFKLIRSVFQQF